MALPGRPRASTVAASCASSRCARAARPPTPCRPPETAVPRSRPSLSIPTPILKGRRWRVIGADCCSLSGTRNAVAARLRGAPPAPLQSKRTPRQMLTGARKVLLRQATQHG